MQIPESVKAYCISRINPVFRLVSSINACEGCCHPTRAFFYFVSLRVRAMFSASFGFSKPFLINEMPDMRIRFSRFELFNGMTEFI